AVVSGDDTQIDLPHRRDSGLLHVEQVLKSVEGLTFTHFESSDVVRHPLVKRIVDAYAADDKSNSVEK
ncbi:MAG: PhoH family protein, partial [Pseudomonadales bacterium]